MMRRLRIWKVCKRGRASVNVRHTQGVSFLPKMSHERVRGRASGRGLPAFRFFSASPPPHLFNVWLQNWCKIQDFVYIHQHLDSHSPAIFSVASKAVNIQGYEYFSNEVYLKLFFFSQFILAVAVASAFSLIARRVLWSTHALYSYIVTDALLLETGSYSH